MQAPCDTRRFATIDTAVRCPRINAGLQIHASGEMERKSRGNTLEVLLPKRNETAYAMTCSAQAQRSLRNVSKRTRVDCCTTLLGFRFGFRGRVSNVCSSTSSAGWKKFVDFHNFSLFVHFRAHEGRRQCNSACLPERTNATAKTRAHHRNCSCLERLVRRELKNGRDDD